MTRCRHFPRFAFPARDGFNEHSSCFVGQTFRIASQRSIRIRMAEHMGSAAVAPGPIQP